MRFFPSVLLIFALAAPAAEACRCRAFVERWDAEDVLRETEFLADAIPVQQRTYLPPGYPEDLASWQAIERWPRPLAETEFEIVRMYNGTPRERVIVRHDLSGQSTCGFLPFLGTLTLLAARRSEDGTYTTDICLMMSVRAANDDDAVRRAARRREGDRP